MNVGEIVLCSLYFAMIVGSLAYECWLSWKIVDESIKRLQRLQ